MGGCGWVDGGREEVKEGRRGEWIHRWTDGGWMVDREVFDG